MAKKIRVVVLIHKEDPDQFGDGYYKMLACFPTLGVHVPYIMYGHSENEYVEKVGRPCLCHGKDETDGRKHIGHLEFCAPWQLLEKAREFKARQKAKRR